MSYISEVARSLNSFYKKKGYIPDPMSDNFEEQMSELDEFLELDVTERGGCHGHYADESMMEAQYGDDEQCTSEDD